MRSRDLVLCIFLCIIKHVYSDLCTSFAFQHEQESGALNLMHLALPGTSSTFFGQMIDKVVKQVGNERCIRGYECSINMTCPGDVQAFLCVGESIHFIKHQHCDYERMLLHAARIQAPATYEIVTFLREPLDYAVKCYHLRNMWDKKFNEYKPIDAPFLINATIEEWTELAYWRWNIEARTFAGQLGSTHQILNNVDGITREEALQDNHDGRKSALYQLAIINLQSMKFIGLFEDMKDSYDLFFDTFCYRKQGVFSGDDDIRHKAPRSASIKTVEIIQSRYTVDVELYNWAAATVRQRVNDMRARQVH